MRILTITLMAAVAGSLVGSAVAYLEVWADPDAAVLPENSASLAPSRAYDKGPRAQVDEPIFDFGTMQRGTKKSHTFMVMNAGAAPLTISVESKTCTCTVGEVTEGPIPPGAAGRVRLEWTAKGDSGPFRQSATILTNDPLNSRIELSFEGTVTAATGVAPPEFVFDKIAFGETKSAEVFVMAMLQDELTVRDPQLSDPLLRDNFDVQIEPVERASLPNPLAKAAVRITLTAKPGLPVGRFHQSLVLQTNLPEAEHLEIPVSGRVGGDISVHGTGWNEEEGVLVLGKVDSHEGRKTRLNVVVRGEEAANVKLEVKSVDPPELRVTIGEPKQFKPTLLHVPVDIEVPAGTRPMVRLSTAQGDEARIVLSTTHPSIKELVLGVRFAVER